MEARYSNLPHMPTDLSPLSKEEPPTDVDWRDEAANITQKNSMGDWVSTVWALIAHCILSASIMVFILAFLDGRHFNVTLRSPPVKTVRGMQTLNFSLMQSDVVTILSSMIVVLRCALVAWSAPLCWRVALFLMERRGLTHRDLKFLLDYGVLAPSAFSKHFAVVIIGVLLLANLAANVSSPLLTGSISWIPTSQLAYGLPTDSVSFEEIELVPRTSLLDDYRNNDYERDLAVSNSAGVINFAWARGRDAEKGVYKRVSDSIEALAVNSTIKNVTLPYFKVHSMLWIEDVNEIPTVKYNGTADILKKVGDSAPARTAGFPFGYTLLVPNVTTDWANDTMDPSVIQDTRLLVVYYGIDQPWGIQTVSPNLPASIYRLYQDRRYYVFAWVTFSAGIGRCKEYQCIVSSPSTVQNNTPIALEPHPLTFQALSMAPIVANSLVAQNASIPSSWANLDDYVEAILVRSYSGAWNSLNSNMARIFRATTVSSYVPSFPSLVAHVDRTRVYVWFCIQLLVTLLGVIFLFFQSTLSEHPLIGDTTLTAFYLNTLEVPAAESPTFRFDGVLKVEPQGDRLKVKYE